MRMNRSVGPPGGHHFPVSENVTLRAVTWKLLHEAIYSWRVENSMPLGDIEHDMDAYYCSKWPERCAPDAADNQWPAGVSPDDKMSDRVVKWIGSMLDARRLPQGGWPLAPIKTAEARAAACAACHRNKPFPSTCSPCDESVNRASARVRNHRSNGDNHALHGCEVFSWDCAAACHLADESLGIAADDPRRKLTPLFCWMRAEKSSP